MTNREVDHIVHDLKGMHSNSDFSQVGTEIRNLQQSDPTHFQRNLDQINSSVDMKSLGFPSDFRIAGVNAQNRMVTISEDGSKVEQRDMRTMQVQQSSANNPAIEHWGTRDVTTNPVDNGKVYTTKAGDTLWSIARDSLSHQNNGQNPSASDVETQVRAIARENHLTDPNKLGLHSELRIPAESQAHSPNSSITTRSADGPYKPNLAADSPTVQPQDGVSNPIAAPGLANDGDRAVRNRTQGLTERTENGNTTTNYTGQLRDGWITDTNFTAQRTTNQNGRLTHSQVNYDGAGAEIKLQTPTGEQTLQGVQSVRTDFNARTGRYDTSISTASGARYQAVTGRDGHVVAYVQSHVPTPSDH